MEAELAPTSRRSFMVVDDDDAIRELIETVVAVAGYRVVTAANGQDALDRLRSGITPGVILLDLRMPVMDGRTFCSLQKRDPDLAAIPIVIFSGDLDAARAAASLGTEVLVKPIDLDRLCSIAQRYCGTAPAK